MNFMWIFIALFVCAFISLVIVFVLIKRTRRISDAARHRLSLAWQNAMGIADPSRRVLEAEKVCDQIFHELGFRGTFGEKLKKASPILPAIDTLWRAHKIRNRIAHETGFVPSKAQSLMACDAFGTVVGKFVGGPAAFPKNLRYTDPR